MSFRIRKNKYKKPVYVKTESKEKVLDEDGKPVLDKDGNNTYKVVNVSSGDVMKDVKSKISNKSDHCVSSSLQIRKSHNYGSCDYF